MNWNELIGKLLADASTSSAKGRAHLKARTDLLSAILEVEKERDTLREAEKRIVSQSTWEEDDYICRFTRSKRPLPAVPERDVK